MGIPLEEATILKLVRPVTEKLHGQRGAAAFVVARDTKVFAALPPAAKQAAGSGPAVSYREAGWVAQKARLMETFCRDSGGVYNETILASGLHVPFVLVVFHVDGLGDVARCVKVECQNPDHQH